MWKRALAVCLLALGACSGDSTTKDLAADLPAVHDGLAREQLAFPDGPGREAQAGDRSLIEQRAPDVGAPDKPKPDAGPGFCGSTNNVLRCDCYGKSRKTGQFIKLWGKAQQVTSFGDFKVRVDSFGKLKVKQMTSGFASNCGEWLTTTSFPDFTYEVVTIGEDFTIKYDSWPGIDKVGCPTCP